MKYKINVVVISILLLAPMFTLSSCKDNQKLRDQKEQNLAQNTEQRRSSVSDTSLSTPPPAALSDTIESIEKLPRLLELGSVGCRPCDMMAPILEELRKDYQGRLSVEFYDVRKDPAPAQKYRIRLIPTQIFLDAEGREFFRHEGFFPRQEIASVLDSLGVAR